MYFQVDQDGFSQMLLKSIIDYINDGHSVTKYDMYVTTKANRKRSYQTTIGWKLLVKFRDVSEKWVPLKIIKETNPIEVSEFAMTRAIADEPAFCLWVPYTLWKRYHTIADITSCARNNSHKYGIEVPSDLYHYKQLYSINGNCLWK